MSDKTENPDRVIAANMGDYYAVRIVIVDGELYYGGSGRGYHPIDRQEAVARLLAWGYEPREIRKMLDGGDT